MKAPLIIASLILPAILLAACKPALIPPVAQGDIHAASDADWKRSPVSISSGHDHQSPITGISLAPTGNLQATAQTPERSAGLAQTVDDLHAAEADRALQSKQRARRSLTLQLLQTLSAARP